MRGSGFARLENSPAVENEFEAVQAAGAYAPLTLLSEHTKAPTLRPNVRAKPAAKADALGRAAQDKPRRREAKRGCRSGSAT